MNTTQKEKESHKRLQGRCQRERESKMHSLETTDGTLCLTCTRVRSSRETSTTEARVEATGIR